MDCNIKENSTLRQVQRQAGGVQSIHVACFYAVPRPEGHNRASLHRGFRRMRFALTYKTVKNQKQVIYSFHSLFISSFGAFGALRRRYVTGLADARPFGLALRATAPHR